MAGSRHSTSVRRHHPVEPGHPSMPVKPGRTMSSSRELPMPNVTHMTSLNQAHATLLHCWTRLSRFVRDSGSDTATPSQRRAQDDERRRFRHWLHQWELAFSAFLAAAVTYMGTDDITHSRVLKTNHLACVILASDPSRDLDAEYQAIVDLAGAVLSSRRITGSPRSGYSSASESGSSLRGLDVREPLVVLLARCGRSATRARASELLSQYY